MKVYRLHNKAAAKLVLPRSGEHCCAASLDRLQPESFVSLSAE